MGWYYYDTRILIYLNYYTFDTNSELELSGTIDDYAMYKYWYSDTNWMAVKPEEIIKQRAVLYDYHCPLQKNIINLL